MASTTEARVRTAVPFFLLPFAVILRADMRFLLDETWLVFMTVCIALFTASMLGYRLALSTRINEDSHHHEHVTGLRDGLFVLLGLLLGFAVAIVLPRFDER